MESTFRIADGVRDSLAGQLVLRPGVSAIALLDAVSIGDEFDVFEALNEAFRFPVYFGWNWDALYDCLSDLSWIPADRYMVVIENSERLQVEAGHVHGRLVEVLQRAVRSWSSRAHSKRPVEFSVLLSRSVEGVDIRRRFRTFGIDVAG